MTLLYSSGESTAIGKVSNICMNLYCVIKAKAHQCYTYGTSACCRGPRSSNLVGVLAIDKECQYDARILSGMSLQVKRLTAKCIQQSLPIRIISQNMNAAGIEPIIGYIKK